MKRVNNIYEEIYQIENLRTAHFKASKGKRHYKEVKKIDKRLNFYLRKIQKMLINETYTTSKYKVKTIHDSGKVRTIHVLPYYPDRIIQWAIMLKLENIFIRSFTKDTYSAIPERGIHKLFYELKSVLKKEKTLYCLKLDICKYYQSIDHTILKNLFKRKIKDEKLLYLLENIVDSLPDGVPIGNYTSQYFANFYLSYFDHWVKENLKVKYYFRYMDDIVLLSRSKRKISVIKRKVFKHLSEKLQLKIKNNWQIFLVSDRGIDFVGYRFFKEFILLRKSIVQKFKKKMGQFNTYKKISKSNIASIMSYYGWLKHCNGYNLFNKYTENLI